MARPYKDSTTFKQRVSGGSYTFRYRDELGRDRWKSAPTLTGAKQLRARLVLEAKERKLGLRPSAREDERVRLTVADLIERYRPEFEALKSARDSKRYAKLWKRELGKLLASEVRPGDVEAWRRGAQSTGLAPNTLNSYTSFLRRIYNLAIRDELLISNPVGNGRVKPLKGIGRRERVINPEEENLLLPALRPVDRAAVVIALYTGLRRGEIMGLQRSGIDLDRSMAHLFMTKAGDGQSVVLSGLVLDAVRWLMDAHDNEFLFPNRRGDKAATGDMLLVRVKKAAASVGLSGILVHTLRHTFVTRVIAQGTDISTAQKLARHSTITMTNHYVHQRDQAKLEAVELLAMAAGHRPDLFPVAPGKRAHLRVVAPS